MKMKTLVLQVPTFVYKTDTVRFIKVLTDHADISMHLKYNIATTPGKHYISVKSSEMDVIAKRLDEVFVKFEEVAPSGKQEVEVLLTQASIGLKNCMEALEVAGKTKPFTNPGCNEDFESRIRYTIERLDDDLQHMWDVFYQLSNTDKSFMEELEKENATKTTRLSPTGLADDPSPIRNNHEQMRHEHDR